MGNPWAKCAWFIDAIEVKVILFEMEQFPCKEVQYDAPTSILYKNEGSLIRWLELYGVAWVNEKFTWHKFPSL